MADTDISLWLRPQEPLRTTLSAIVRRLARDLQAIEFEPHVTVFCGRSSDEEAEETAREIAARFPPMELTAERLGYTSSFTKTLFVEFLESASARELSEAARRGCARPSDYVFRPHLSLVYKTLLEARQRQLCGSLDVPMGAYVFDRIRMIETRLPIAEAAAVRQWREVCDVALKGR